RCRPRPRRTPYTAHRRPARAGGKTSQTSPGWPSPSPHRPTPAHTPRSATTTPPDAPPPTTTNTRQPPTPPGLRAPTRSPPAHPPRGHARGPAAAPVALQLRGHRALPVIAGHHPGEPPSGRAAQRAGLNPGALQGLPRGLQQQPLLRIHRQRLTRGDPKKPRI